MTASLPDKERALRQHIHHLAGTEGKLLIAYSGGVDSTLVLAVAQQEIGARAVAVLAVSPSLMDDEKTAAIALAQKLGAPLRCIETREMDDENYAANPANRCYFCKTHLYRALRVLSENEHFAAICDGTNADDLREWRPGAQAATEHQIISPLREADFSKTEVRELAHHMNLPNADKPAMPCLASRIPYGTPVSPETLHRIGRAESILRGLGLHEVRVRHYTENNTATARIEVAPNEMEAFFRQRELVFQELRVLGYDAVLLDLEGYRRGKMNDVLSSKTFLSLSA